MNVDVSQPFSHKLVIVDELNYLVIVCAGCHRKVLKEREYFCPVFEGFAGEFTDYERVTNYMAIIQECFKSDSPGT